MDSFADPFTYPVLSLGLIAAEAADQAVESPIDGKVVAVFASTFYVDICQRLICVGHAGLEPGPLNCITSAPAETDWRASGVKAGAKIRVAAGVIRAGNVFIFPLAGCQRWQPAKRALPDATKLRLGIASFRRAIDGRVDLDGLGYFPVSAPPSPVLQLCTVAANYALIDARNWLTDGFQERSSSPHEVTTWVTQLCGLGPGLTPSGDDFLSGMMIALNTLNEIEMKESLWRLIEDSAHNQTTAVSLAHLSAAARGFEGATICRAVSAITGGSDRQIAGSVDDLSLVGHSSGWDMIAGIITTFEKWLGVVGHVAESHTTPGSRVPALKQKSWCAVDSRLPIRVERCARSQPISH